MEEELERLRHAGMITSFRVGRTCVGRDAVLTVDVWMPPTTTEALVQRLRTTVRSKAGEEHVLVLLNIAALIDAIEVDGRA